MKILFLTTVLPYARSSGGEIVSSLLVDAIRRAGHDITVLGYRRTGTSLDLSPWFCEISERYIESRDSLFHTALWMALAMGKSLPFSSTKYYSRRYVRKLRRLLAAPDEYDLTIVDHAQLGWVMQEVRHKTRTIFVAHNVEHHLYNNDSDHTITGISMKRRLASVIYIREARLIKLMEDYLSRSTDLTWTLSASDTEYFSSISGGRPVITLKVPPLYAPADDLDYAPENDIAILGTWTWKANHDGLSWFFKSVYPLLPKTVSIQVGGRGADWLIDRYKNVRYLGFVDDAFRFLRNSRVVAIPSIAGAGLQIKTLDSIASGVPVVATRYSLRGIDNPPRSLVAADTPVDFASAIVRFLNNNSRDFYREEGALWCVDRTRIFTEQVSCSVEGLCGKPI